jgi:DNA-binding transcriptional ArsR family regulator
MNRRKIVTAIRAKPSTFSELCVVTGLSKPIMTEHLKYLRNGGIITRRGTADNDRIEYVLTENGAGSEKLRSESFASYMQTMRDLVHDYPMAKALFELARAARKDPELVEAAIEQMNEFLILFERWWEDLLRRSGVEPEDWPIIKDEVLKRLPPRPPEQPPPEFMNDRLMPIDDLLKSLRESLAKTNQTTKTRRSEK